VFHDLSVTFPKGRRIVVLGHSGAGKTTLFELMLQERPPTRGRIIINSRLSWPVHSFAFLDPRLSVRQNAIFISHILGVDPRRMIDAVQGFLELPHKQLHESVKSLSPKLRRRFGVVAVMAANFECLLIDMPMKGQLFGLKGAQAEALEAAILDHDYIMATNAVRMIPANCDLVYILYEGRFYLFEDVEEAKSVYNSLPIPPNPGGRREQPAEEDEDEDEYREEAF
jgi:ABC-type polysaccharide/polyol phosphate transport system ATPase subunit